MAMIRCPKCLEKTLHETSGKCMNPKCGQVSGTTSGPILPKPRPVVTNLTQGGITIINSPKIVTQQPMVQTTVQPHIVTSTVVNTNVVNTNVVNTTKGTIPLWKQQELERQKQADE